MVRHLKVTTYDKTAKRNLAYNNFHWYSMYVEITLTQSPKCWNYLVDNLVVIITATCNSKIVYTTQTMFLLHVPWSTHSMANVITIAAFRYIVIMIETTVILWCPLCSLKFHYYTIACNNQAFIPLSCYVVFVCNQVVSQGRHPTGSCLVGFLAWRHTLISHY